VTLRERQTIDSWDILRAVSSAAQHRRWQHALERSQPSSGHLRYHHLYALQMVIQCHVSPWKELARNLNRDRTNTVSAKKKKSPFAIYTAVSGRLDNYSYRRYTTPANFELKSRVDEIADIRSGKVCTGRSI
jgi:hypothetical protein